jgi:hypothetical protein
MSDPSLGGPKRWLAAKAARGACAAFVNRIASEHR